MGEVFSLVLPLQSLGQRLLQVGGGCREGELDSDAAAVVEDGGEVVSFRGGQDGQLVVGLTYRRNMGASNRAAAAYEGLIRTEEESDVAEAAGLTI